MPDRDDGELATCPTCGAWSLCYDLSEYEVLTTEEADAVITELRERLAALERENAGLRAELQRPLPGLEG